MSLTLFFKCPRCSGSRFLNYSTQTAVKTRIHERDQFFILEARCIVAILSFRDSFHWPKSALPGQLFGAYSVPIRFIIESEIT